jgi:hypothetical protein
MPCNGLILNKIEHRLKIVGKEHRTFILELRDLMPKSQIKGLVFKYFLQRHSKRLKGRLKRSKVVFQSE